MFGVGIIDAALLAVCIIIQCHCLVLVVACVIVFDMIVSLYDLSISILLYNKHICINVIAGHCVLDSL